MARIAMVGAGPGRADLLTLRAARLLAEAGAVLYDRLVSEEVLAVVNPHAELHEVGKVEGLQEAIQGHIYELADDCARRHELVVRLKGGDPMVFGRGGEEWMEFARRGHEVEYVPGVSSAIAVPGLVGIPPTFRNVAGGFAVVTGHRAATCQEWAAYARIDTLVILMAVSRRAEIAGCLLSQGRSAEEPVAFVENGSRAQERIAVTTLGQVAAGVVEVKAPAVMVVGAVVKLREQLAVVASELCATV